MKERFMDKGTWKEILFENLIWLIIIKNCVVGLKIFSLVEMSLLLVLHLFFFIDVEYSVQDKIFMNRIREMELKERFGFKCL